MDTKPNIDCGTTSADAASSLVVPSGEPLPPYQDCTGCTVNESEIGVMKFLNIKDNELVHQRLLIVHGHVPGVSGSDDKITVHHPDFPALTFPAVDGYFKAIVHLDSGENELEFHYLQGDSCTSKGKLVVKMEPFTARPALKLAILVASDSSETFDAPPGMRGPGLNDLDAATRKLRCSAYLWQAFVAEHLYRHGFGRRTFRLEEECAPDTMGCDNKDRMTARVHVLRPNRTVAEIQDKYIAQQWNSLPEDPLWDPCKLVDIHRGAIMESEELGCGGTVACLTLDSHWDPEAEIILGHGAYGSNSSGLGVGIFGSHTTHAWPACAEEIAEKFLDTTAIDTSILANDAGEGGEYWQAANIGMGALFHMAAMAMWIDSGPTGIIQRGYKHFSRAFMAKEPGHEGPIKQGDEGRAHLNRLSAVGLRHHPCLRMPGDVISEMAVEFISATDDGVVIHSKTGVILVEVLVNNKHCTHMEYTAENFGRRQSGQILAEADEAAAVFPTQIALGHDRLRGLVGELAESDEVVLSVTSLNRDWPQQREIRRLAKL